MSLEELDNEELKSDIKSIRECKFAQEGEWMLADMIEIMILEIRGLRNDLRAKNG